MICGPSALLAVVATTYSGVSHYSGDSLGEPLQTHLLRWRWCRDVLAGASLGLSPWQLVTQALGLCTSKVDGPPLLLGWHRGAGWERKFAYLVVDRAQEFDECLVVFLTLIGNNQNRNISYLSITSKTEQFDECLNCQILHLREKNYIYIYSSACT